MKKSYLLPIILMIYSCSTPYQPYGALGGYKSTELDDNTFRVMFKGNPHTKPETIYNYLERRCAEITVENRFEYFIVFEDSSYIGKIDFASKAGLDESLAQQRPNEYLLNQDPVIDTDPEQTLNYKKTKIERTYWNGTIENKSTHVVGILKIHLANEVKRGFENHYLSAKQILEKYKIE